MSSPPSTGSADLLGFAGGDYMSLAFVLAIFAGVIRGFYARVSWAIDELSREQGKTNPVREESECH